MPLVVFIEGNIAAGKSSVVSSLKKHCGGGSSVVWLTEPVDQWVQRGFLDYAYSGAATPAAFQNMVMVHNWCRLAGALEDESVEVIVCERSFFTNYHVFAPLNLGTGPDYELLRATFGLLLDRIRTGVDFKFVYLNVSPQLAHRRCKQRARGREASLPESYFVALDELHRKWLGGVKGCVVVDASKRPREVVRLTARAILDHIRDIKKKLVNTR